MVIISSSDFPFNTDGAALTSGALAVAGVGVSVVDGRADVPAPAVAPAVVVVDVSAGFAVVEAPNKPVPGVLAAAGFAPNSDNGVVVVVAASPVEEVAGVEPG